MIDAGIPCVSRSTLNTRSGGHQSFENCVQDERGKTGEGFKVVGDVVDGCEDGKMVSFECVVGLLKKRLNMKSDAEYMRDVFEEKGWWMLFRVMDAVEFGSPELERLRAWWAGAKHLAGAMQTLTRSS